MPLVVQDFIGSIVKLAPLPKACDGHHRHLTRPSAIMFLYFMVADDTRRRIQECVPISGPYPQIGGVI
jgi:hypothetical protein